MAFYLWMHHMIILRVPHLVHAYLQIPSVLFPHVWVLLAYRITAFFPIESLCVSMEVKLARSFSNGYCSYSFSHATTPLTALPQAISCRNPIREEKAVSDTNYIHKTSQFEHFSISQQTFCDLIHWAENPHLNYIYFT